MTKVDKRIWEILRAIADGYAAQGKDDRFVVVDNPKASAENMAMHGVEPCLVLDMDAISVKPERKRK